MQTPTTPCFPDYYDYPEKRTCLDSRNEIGPDGFCGPHRPPSDMSAEKDTKAGEPSYPTAWAYEQVCKARTKWQERAEGLLAAAKLARSALDSLMGDSDPEGDDSPEMRAMQALSEAIAKAGG